MNKKYGDELNNLEKDLLKYIEKNISSKGVSPSLRDITENVDIKSPTTVKKYLNSIEEKGYIEIVEENNRMSGIRLKTKLFKEKKDTKRYSTIDNIKTASIPLFGRIYEKSNLFNEINYEELISVPVSVGMQENMFAFKANKDDFREMGMPKSSIIIVDKKIKPIHGDYVAKYVNGNFDIAKYERGKDEDIIGKIIGSYIDIKY